MIGEITRDFQALHAPALCCQSCGKAKPATVLSSWDANQAFESVFLNPDKVVAGVMLLVEDYVSMVQSDLVSVEMGAPSLSYVTGACHKPGWTVISMKQVTRAVTGATQLTLAKFGGLVYVQKSGIATGGYMSRNLMALALYPMERRLKRDS